MRIYRFIVVAICLCFITLSCKRTGREVAEKISVELTERSAKELVDKGAEKSLKTLTKSQLRDMEWDDVLRMIKSKDINLEQ